MRIISGSNKGKKLIMPNDKTTRPLKDMAKESIFNILSHANYINFHLKDSKVLDLFSGIGSFGLECLSRGVLKVTFIENYKKVLPILKKNLDNFKLVNNYKIIEVKEIHPNLQIIFGESIIRTLISAFGVLYEQLLPKNEKLFFEFKKKYVKEMGIILKPFSNHNHQMDPR